MTDPQDPEVPWWQRLRQTPVTAALMALCILVYAATLSAAISIAEDPATTAFRSLWRLENSEIVFRNFGGLELTRVWVDGEWWRVLTTGLLHGSLLHLAFNVLSLASISEYIEHAWGSTRTLVLFILSSVSGCLASLLWCEAPLVVGASAGVFGMAGALYSARRFGDPATQAQLSDLSDFRLALLILLSLAAGAFIPGIAQAGHVGGLVMGAAIGLTWSRPRPAWQHLLAATLGVGALATLVTLARTPTWSTNYHLFLGVRAVDDNDKPSALTHFNNAIALDPESPDPLNTIAYKLAIATPRQDWASTLEWAESLAQKAVASDPEKADHLDTLGWILCRRGRPDEGLPIIQKAIKILGDDPGEEISQHIPDCPGASADP